MLSLQRELCVRKLAPNQYAMSLNDHQFINLPVLWYPCVLYLRVHKKVLYQLLHSSPVSFSMCMYDGVLSVTLQHVKYNRVILWRFSNVTLAVCSKTLLIWNQESETHSSSGSIQSGTEGHQMSSKIFAWAAVGCKFHKNVNVNVLFPYNYFSVILSTLILSSA